MNELIPTRTHADSAPPTRFAAAIARTALIILAMAMIVAAFLYLRSIDLAEDDAYITFRYAANARSGRGLVYNEGKRVCGVSSPLYLLIVTAASSVFPSTPVDVVALRLNLLPLLATSLGAYLLLRRLTGHSVLSSFISAAVMLDARMLTHATDGMESTWFLTWLLASLWAIDLRRPALIGLLCGLATLTRPEGLLLLPIAALNLRKSPRGLIRALVLFVITTAPWLIFAGAYYGSPIPLSIIAKARPLYPLPTGHALRTMIEVLGACWLVAVGAASAIAVVSIRPARPPILYFYSLIAFYMLSNPFMMPWYYPPLRALGLMILALTWVGLARIARARHTTVASWTVALTALSLAAYTLIPYRLEPLAGRVRTPERLRVIAYRDAAQRLRTMARPQERTVAPEVGAFGYFFGGFVTDACALVSPEALPYLPVPPDERISPEVGAVSPRLVQDLKPDWIVTIPIFIREGLLTKDWFLREYRLAARVPLPVETFSEREVLILRRSP